MDWATIALILTALGVGSAITKLIDAWINRKKRSAETEKAQSDSEHADQFNQAHLANLFASTAGELVKAQNLQINELQQEFAKYKAETKAEMATLICEIGRLEGKIEHLEGELAEKNDEAESMQQEIRTLNKELAEKDRKIKHLENENALLRDRVSELERKLNNLVGKQDDKS